MDPILHPEFTHYLVAAPLRVLHRVSPALLRGRARPDRHHPGHRRLRLAARAADQPPDVRPLLPPANAAGHRPGESLRHQRLPPRRRRLRALLPTAGGDGHRHPQPDPVALRRLGLAALKARIRRRICFHGAVDNQQTLPFGTPKTCAPRSSALIETLATDGTGYIIGALPQPAGQYAGREHRRYV